MFKNTLIFTVGSAIGATAYYLLTKAPSVAATVVDTVVDTVVETVSA